MAERAMLDQPMVKTPQGTLLGTTAGQAKDVHVFKGVPYALPPTGVRRWRHAEPAPAWSGLRLANAYGPDAMQPAMPEGNFFHHPIGVSSEDCLYVNVWTPHTGEMGKLPVMVWIHGGGFFQGAGSWPLYD